MVKELNSEFNIIGRKCQAVFALMFSAFFMPAAAFSGAAGNISSSLAISSKG